MAYNDKNDTTSYYQWIKMYKAAKTQSEKQQLINDYKIYAEEYLPQYHKPALEVGEIQHWAGEEQA